MSDGVFCSYAEALRHRRAVLDRLRERALALDTAALDRPRDDGGWSVRQTLEHLAVVAEGMLAVVNKLLDRAAGGAAGPFAVDASGRFRDYRGRRIKTRAPFEPVQNLEPSVSLDRLEAVAETLEALAPRVAAVDPGSVSFRHWELGPLTLAEWLAFVGLHEERHLDALG